MAIRGEMLIVYLRVSPRVPRDEPPAQEEYMALRDICQNHFPLTKG